MRLWKPWSSTILNGRLLSATQRTISALQWVVQLKYGWGYVTCYILGFGFGMASMWVSHLSFTRLREASSDWSRYVVGFCYRLPGFLGSMASIGSHPAFLAPTHFHMPNQVPCRRLILCVKVSSASEFTTTACALENMASATVDVFDGGDGFIESIDWRGPSFHHVF